MASFSISDWDSSLAVVPLRLRSVFLYKSTKLITQVLVSPSWDKPLAVYDYAKLQDHPLIDRTTIGLKGSPTNIFKSFTPPMKGAGTMLAGDGKETTDQLAGILAAKHII